MSKETRIGIGLVSVAALAAANLGIKSMEQDYGDDTNRPVGNTETASFAVLCDEAIATPQLERVNSMNYRVTCVGKKVGRVLDMQSLDPFRTPFCGGTINYQRNIVFSSNGTVTFEVPSPALLPTEVVADDQETNSNSNTIQATGLYPAAYPDGNVAHVEFIPNNMFIAQNQPYPLLK